MAVPATTRSGERLLTELERMQVALIQAARQLRLIDRAGINPSARSALAAIVKYGPLSMSDLAAHEGVDPASVSRTVRKLEEAGSIARRTAESDARVNLIEVTESGRRLFFRSRRELTQVVLDKVAALPPDQIEAIVAASEGLELLIAATAPKPV
ncbi:MarR family winged helix-turn-helix transcriptional regulator [Nocardia sp. BMG51109]|uniref:MarR family winged helix-turn-helix transcriptional regulator n=1 Tax=Nocardia sp. BMG51109 TaxID=1056816 RepID=UPI000464E0B5|nr:MarR family transcriptional regulator [Nocardia sp. BMG51109]